MPHDINVSSEVDKLRLGVVSLAGVAVLPSSEQLRAWSNTVAKQMALQSDLPEQETLRQEVRQLLRHGKFKASGRSKPAQEYLLRCAKENGELPNINAPVDVLNTVSLQSGLPISLLSLAKCSRQLHVRHGATGESFVFNSAGQDLAVEDLIVVCDRTRDQRPVGSPVKDSMAGKIESSDTDLVAIVYAPRTPLGQTKLRDCVQALAVSFRSYCQGENASQPEVAIVAIEP